MTSGQGTFIIVLLILQLGLMLRRDWKADD